jgi:uncharacterized protein (DUF924 family)
VYPPDVGNASNCFAPVTVTAFGVPHSAYPSAEEVHRFWFADSIDDPGAANARREMWFRCAPAFDDEIRTRFGSSIVRAARGELSTWKDAPSSCVSLVILLDQFPRNAYRNTPAAFEHDALALAVTRHAIAAGHLSALSVVERTFLLMPYQHVEDLGAEREGLIHFERVHANAPPGWRAFSEHTLEFARKHVDIIERFGRFPHRNAVLGRQSTAPEREYLESRPETFGQGG